MRTLVFGLVSGAMLAGGVSAQQPTTPAPAGGATLQQAFDAAVAADAGTDAAAALAAWEPIERRSKAGGRTHSVVLIRKGGALYRLGRQDEAVVAARTGLAALPATDRALDEDRKEAHRILAEVARNTLDYPGAAREFAQMEALAATPGGKAAALVTLIEVQTFTDPAAARATLARADALLAATKFDRRSAAMFARARTLLLLNTGDISGARASAPKAVTLLGGLTTRTDTLDAAARSDAAIAYLLSNDPEEARKYMAFSGAGRLPKGRFDPAIEMRPPECGGEAGLKPEDVAVVEFTISPDGTVARAAPVYAAGGGQVALEFARTARGWAWPAEKIAAMPAFFRYNVRVEMRCSTAFRRPSIREGLFAALDAWLETKGVQLPPEPDNPVAALPAQRAALAAASANDLRTLAAAYQLASSPLVDAEETAALSARALAIAVAADAPPIARLALDLPIRTLTVKDMWKPGVYERALMPLLSEPVYARDPQARAVVRLMLADSAGGRRDKSADVAALTLLRPVADDPALKPADPLRVGALVRIASIQQRGGAADAARTAFAATGLAANQCAVLDAQPQMLSTAGLGNFPMEALRWGFEGFAQVQYDIAADGRTQNQRTLMSYPAFVFSKAGTDFFTRARYAKTFRPDGELGCGGNSSRIRFLLSD